MKCMEFLRLAGPRLMQDGECPGSTPLGEVTRRRGGGGGSGTAQTGRRNIIINTGKYQCKHLNCPRSRSTCQWRRERSLSWRNQEISPRHRTAFLSPSSYIFALSQDWRSRRFSECLDCLLVSWPAVYDCNQSWEELLGSATDALHCPTFGEILHLARNAGNVEIFHQILKLNFYSWVSGGKRGGYLTCSVTDVDGAPRSDHVTALTRTSLSPPTVLRQTLYGERQRCISRTSAGTKF